MRIIVPLVCLTMLASQAIAAHVKRLGSIPESLQGSWAPTAESCASDEKSVIALSGKEYAGAQGKCAIAWVSETASPRGPVYAAQLRCPDAPPSQKTSASNLIIRPEEANRISIGSSFDNLKVYQKCAARQ
jgi:hypothetical protein